MAINNRIFTQVRLIKLGIHGPRRCPFCKFRNKDVDHIILLCPYAKDCWNHFTTILNLQSTLPFKLKDWFAMLPKWTKKVSLNICGH